MRGDVAGHVLGHMPASLFNACVHVDGARMTLSLRDVTHFGSKSWIENLGDVAK